MGEIISVMVAHLLSDFGKSLPQSQTGEDKESTQEWETDKKKSKKRKRKKEKNDRDERKRKTENKTEEIRAIK